MDRPLRASDSCGVMVSWKAQSFLEDLERKTYPQTCHPKCWILSKKTYQWLWGMQPSCRIEGYWRHPQIWLMVSSKNHELPPENTLISSDMAQYKPSKNKQICTRAVHHILIIQAFKKTRFHCHELTPKSFNINIDYHQGEQALLPQWKWFRWIHLNPSLRSKGHLLEALLCKPTPPAAMLYLPNPSFGWKVSFIYHPFASHIHECQLVFLYTHNILPSVD